MDRHVASLLAMTMLSKPVIMFSWQIPLVARDEKILVIANEAQIPVIESKAQILVIASDLQILVIASEAWQSISWCQATSSGQYKRIGLSTSSLC